MREKAKAHNAPHSERFDPPVDDEEPRDGTPTGTGWVEEEHERDPHRHEPPPAQP